MFGIELGAASAPGGGAPACRRPAGGRADDRGHAAETLIEPAAARSADLIVIGSHGRTGLARLLLGSVARSVLIHAPMSVLVTTGAA